MKIKSLTVIGFLVLSSLFLFTKKYFQNENIHIQYPLDMAIFPAEFPSPTFVWNDPDSTQNEWEVILETSNKVYSYRNTVRDHCWKPDISAWDSLKLLSGGGKINFTIKRLSDSNAKSSKGQICFSISKDSVGAPILYREVILPFFKAELMLDSMSYRLCNVGSVKPAHIVMKGFPVCGNCHSSSENGKTLALDLDAGNRDKGGYFIADIKDTVVLDQSNYLSWTQLQNKNTFGMFSKISPDGRYIVTTMRDRVLVKNFNLDIPEQIKYSQLFFPVNGVLGVYDRKTGIIKELPGANSNGYVQSNAIWTPDGKHIIFARAKALPYYGDSLRPLVTHVNVIEDFTNSRREFKYDLYIVPFNNGAGGEAKPIKGASHNGKSNYFPAISPDGKWLVFCQAQNFMLLMPDSKLFIVNMENGKSKRMKCNFEDMNSWHSWSPNGKWVVFSSKGLNLYTDLFLTHINEKGEASVPVLIENTHRDKYAANYPEFVNVNPSFEFTMNYRFVEITHIRNALYRERDLEKARELFRQFLAQGKIKLVSEFVELARIGMDLQEYQEANKCLLKGAAIQKDNPEINALVNIIKDKLEN